MAPAAARASRRWWWTVLVAATLFPRAPLAAQCEQARDTGEQEAPIAARADDGATLLNGRLTGGGLDQIQPPAGPAPTPRHTGVRALVKDLGSDVTHLPSKENLFWVGVGGGLALAVHPADDNVNQSLVSSDFARNFFKPGQVLGSLGTLLGSATVTYAVGRLRDQPKVSHVGMDLIEAIAVSEGLTQALKYAVRRERPDGSSRNSFPSGHAADTFAFATALERHLGWKGAVPAYVLASYVAISRLPANRHWLSDAVFGSAVGIVAGRTVTRHGRPFPHVSVVPSHGGVAFVYTRVSPAD
jgi:membrane-associated phospholipid phosphatase